MKLIDRNGRLFGKISIVDVVVILVVATLAGAIYIKTHKPQTGSNVTTSTIVYQMKLENQPEYMLDAIRIGDQMFDKERSTGGSLGTITDIEVTQGSNQAKLDNGTVAMVPAENHYNILLTIEGQGLVEAQGGYVLNRIYDIGVNSKRNFNTKYANFIGTIVNIQVPEAGTP